MAKDARTAKEIEDSNLCLESNSLYNLSWEFVKEVF